MTVHHGYPRGKRVLVILRNGSRFVARWKYFDGKQFCFLDHEPIREAKLRVVQPFCAGLPGAAALLDGHGPARTDTDESDMKNRKSEIVNPT